MRSILIDFIGAFLLTALLFLPGASESRNRRHGEGSASASADSSAAAPADTVWEPGYRSWIETAERLEARRKYDSVLAHLERVISRETGVSAAEARLWRAGYAARHGLADLAASACDSLIREAPRYPVAFREAIGQGVFQAGLAADRPELAEAGLSLWIAGVVDVAGLDSVEAGFHWDLARLMARDGAPARAQRTHYERALALGLPAPRSCEARLQVILLEAADSPPADSTSAAPVEAGPALVDLPFIGPAPAAFRDPGAAADPLIPGLTALLADPVVRSAAPGVVYTASIELADALYRAGRYREARERYQDLMPVVDSAGDPEWVMVQLADASALSGDDERARALYNEYLSRWPEGVWTDWVRRGVAGIDSAADSAGMEMVP